MRATVETGARLHFGFVNLSAVHDRLFGSLGVGLDAPNVVVTAETASTVDCEHAVAVEYADMAVSLLGVAGAAVTVESDLPRHVGLGSGTQLALATLSAIATAHGLEPAVRERAPALGRGRRSGVGVATFESGGFVLDAGHPADRLEADGSDRVEWTVPEVVARRAVPSDWRFVLVCPDIEPGKHAEEEERSIAAVVRKADPEIAEQVEETVHRQLLPSLASGNVEPFGAGLTTVDELNGAWFESEQRDVYRPPIGTVVSELAAHDAVFGTGQSSWGPTVYGLTTVEHAADARAAAELAMSAAGVDGSVSVVAPRNDGATITIDNKKDRKY